MKIGNFDTDQKVLIIAEIGNNHEGNFSLAEKMIGLAADAGVGAVKFQTIVPHKLVSSTETERIQQLKKFQLTNDEYRKLADIANEKKLLFLSTPFDIESVKFLNDIVPAFKVSSGDNNFFPLLRTICSTGKPIIMSSGLCGFEEIVTSVKYVKSCWKEFNISSELAVLHCVSNYPVQPECANLLSIKCLKDNLNCTIGYSDHTLGIEAAQFAVTLGAKIIEKHFTINKKLSDFRDHQLSADPEEMYLLVQKVEEVQKFLGNYDIKKSAKDQEMISAVRRSIAANKDLNAGEILEFEDLTWLRPGTGLIVGNEKLLIGKKLKHRIKAGEFITLIDVE